MDNANGYEAAAQWAIMQAMAAADRNEMNNGDFGLLSMASEIDRLGAALVRDASSLAEELAKYAARAPNALVHDSTPLDSSIVQDIRANSSKRAALVRPFAAWLHAHTGQHLMAALKAVAAAQAVSA